jgi:hypothetical protein
MKRFVKCKLCDAEIPADNCPLATQREVVDEKETVYCCAIVRRKSRFDQTAINPGHSDARKRVKQE